MTNDNYGMQSVDPDKYRKESMGTLESLNGYGDFKPNAIFTDLAIITALQERGYDFSNFEININNSLGGKPNNVDLDGLLEAIQ